VSSGGEALLKPLDFPFGSLSGVQQFVDRFL